MNEDIYDLTFELEETYWWYIARRRILLDQVNSILRALSLETRPRILEYGCGTGMTLHCLSPIARVYGIDSSDKALAYCRRRGLPHLHKMEIPDFADRSNPFGDPFDIILLLDVLEHIKEERQILRGLRTWLKPGGYLLVSVPAFRFLWSGEDDVSHHLRRYTRKSLNRVLHESDWKVRRESYFNFFLFPIQAGVIVGQRILGSTSSERSNLRPLPRTLNAVLLKMMSMEKNILRFVNLPFGGSIFAITQPR